jgi:hypothetical protein
MFLLEFSWFGNHQWIQFAPIKYSKWDCITRISFVCVFNFVYSPVEFPFPRLVDRPLPPTRVGNNDEMIQLDPHNVGLMDARRKKGIVITSVSESKREVGRRKVSPWGKKGKKKESLRIPENRSELQEKCR